MLKIDLLIEKIKQTNNPSVIGIDTDFDYLPTNMTQSVNSLVDAASAIYEFNCRIIDAVHTIVPCIKLQVAYYEKYGVAGMKCFADTLLYAKSKGLVVISDVKRNDIGATAENYSKSYLSGVEINGKTFVAFDSDFITVNAYLGSDGIVPFVNDCIKTGKGIFVLVKTSNKSSGQLQDKKFNSGETLYEAMGTLVNEWGSSTMGKYGYNSVGAVVGATYPQQAEVLRQLMPQTFFLVPGYGAQGGTASQLKVCFDAIGGGAIVNSSRGIICAYKLDKYKGMTYFNAAYAAAVDMQQDIYNAIR